MEQKILHHPEILTRSNLLHTETHNRNAELSSSPDFSTACCPQLQVVPEKEAKDIIPLSTKIAGLGDPQNSTKKQGRLIIG